MWWHDLWLKRWPEGIPQLPHTRVVELERLEAQLGLDDLTARMARYLDDEAEWLLKHKHPVATFSPGSTATTSRDHPINQRAVSGTAHSATPWSEGTTTCDLRLDESSVGGGIVAHHETYSTNAGVGQGGCARCERPIQGREDGEASDRVSDAGVTEPYWCGDAGLVSVNRIGIQPEALRCSCYQFNPVIQARHQRFKERAEKKGKRPRQGGGRHGSSVEI